MSRSGPTLPVDAAAASVWQLPQPALAKTFAPGLVLGSPVALEGAGPEEEACADATERVASFELLLPPHAAAPAARASATSAIESVRTYSEYAERAASGTDV